MDSIIQAIAILGSLGVFIAWQFIKGLKAHNKILEYKAKGVELEKEMLKTEIKVSSANNDELATMGNELIKRVGRNSGNPKE